ncbi:MAG: glutathione S-transferase N-terminal domain-containing protein [Pseudomonadota bacterium]
MASITLYTWNTPNGKKPAILLEELSLTYELVMINIGKGDQRTPEFRALNPNGKIPALVDEDVTLFESGAILVHLAQKHGAFLPQDPQARAHALSWTFWQVGGLGPMMGQWGYFTRIDEEVPHAIERYLAESIRLLEVVEARLQENEYLAGTDYSIADMMVYPWIVSGYRLIDNAPASRVPPLSALREWAKRIGERPAVQAANARLLRG